MTQLFYILTNEQIFLFVQAETGENSKTEKKSRVNRKHVIIGVTCAVVTAIVITGVLVGVKFFLDSTNDIVKVWQLLLVASCLISLLVILLVVV